METVNLKQAKGLKNIGYPQRFKSSFGWYNKEGKFFNSSIDVPTDEDESECVAPSFEYATEWLRKEKNIHITPIFNPKANKYEPIIYFPNKDEDKTYSKVTMPRYCTYEEAISVGIDVVLETIS